MQVFGVIFLLLIVVSVTELYVLVQVGETFGALPTIGLMLLISVIGAWLVRREGAGVFARIQQQLFGGNLPSKEIADGALIMFGGTLLLTPGFVTDAVGLGLLIPPIRAVVRNVLLKRFEAKRKNMTAQFVTNIGNQAGRQRASGTWPSSGDVIDVDVTRVDEPTQALPTSRLDKKNQS